MLRRLEKRIYVSLPDADTRYRIFELYLSDEMFDDEKKINDMLTMSKNYSGADIKLLCKQAWMIQISPLWKKLDREEISVTHLTYKLKDFEVVRQLFEKIPPTVTNVDLYTQWKNYKAEIPKKEW